MSTSSLSAGEIPKSAAPTKERSFQERVDYASKALKRGSWGRSFEACFEEHDGEHVAAVVMARAERNSALKEAILAAFKTRDWNSVPWQRSVEKFAGKSSREIAILAEESRALAKAKLDEALTGIKSEEAA